MLYDTTKLSPHLLEPEDQPALNSDPCFIFTCIVQKITNGLVQKSRIWPDDLDQRDTKGFTSKYHRICVMAKILEKWVLLYLNFRPNAMCDVYVYDFNFYSHTVINLQEVKAIVKSLLDKYFDFSWLQKTEIHLVQWNREKISDMGKLKGEDFGLRCLYVAYELGVNRVAPTSADPGDLAVENFCKRIKWVVWTACDLETFVKNLRNDLNKSKMKVTKNDLDLMLRNFREELETKFRKVKQGSSPQAKTKRPSHQEYANQEQKVLFNRPLSSAQSISGINQSRKIIDRPNPMPVDHRPVKQPVPVENNTSIVKNKNAESPGLEDGDSLQTPGFMSGDSDGIRLNGKVKEHG
jgi:hypothetical protein